MNVVPSDTVDLPTPARFIWVGVTGHIAVIGVGDSAAVTFKAVPIGWFDSKKLIQRIMATNTTATNMVAK